MHYNEIDQLLIQVYLQGFKDELHGKDLGRLFLKAYVLGELDALSDSDKNSDEQILNRIHNKNQ